MKSKQIKVRFSLMILPCFWTVSVDKLTAAHSESFQPLCFCWIFCSDQMFDELFPHIFAMTHRGAWKIYKVRLLLRYLQTENRPTIRPSFVESPVPNFLGAKDRYVLKFQIHKHRTPESPHCNKRNNQRTEIYHQIKRCELEFFLGLKFSDSLWHSFLPFVCISLVSTYFTTPAAAHACLH